jgi:N6-adenosine-specific RNA methylase IME4
MTPPDWPTGKFSCITADPPWHFRARTALQSRDFKSARDAEKHYDTMCLDDIAALPVGDLAAENCHLWLWVTGPMLVQGSHLPIMKSWGFKPSAIGFVWCKLQSSYDPARFRMTEKDFFTGLGMTTRKNCEFVILGRRAKSKRLSKSVKELIIAPRRQHSRKPEIFFERVEAYCAGPRLELFARQSRPNWTTWGAENTKFDAP